MTYPNRTLCNVLDEMRKCVSTNNFSYLPGLIEEVQSMGNRMESALEDKDDIKNWTEERSKLYKEIRALRKEKRELKKEVSGEEDDDSHSSILDRL